jgi:hypothetical protein
MVMQSSRNWERCDSSSALNASEARGPVQPETGPDLVIVNSIRSEAFAQVRFAEHYEVIESLPANRGDQPLDMSVLPRRTSCGGAVANARRPYASAQGVTVCVVAIADQVSIEAPGPTERLRSPDLRSARRADGGDAEAHQTPAVAMKDHETAEQLEGETHPDVLDELVDRRRPAGRAASPDRSRGAAS